MNGTRQWMWLVPAALLAWSGCGGGGPDDGFDDGLTNPFLEDQGGTSKEDTLYYNPDGVEVEVDLEADIEGPAWRLFDGPAELGQYAVTYLRKRGQFFLESLAEDATSDERVEWLVEGTWLTAAEARDLPGEQLTHFRIRGVNAVLLFDWADDAHQGKVFTAEVPVNPYTVMTDAGESCADPDSHINLSQSVYWYQWNPDRAGCEMRTQQMTVTISRMLPTNQTVYPEYDRLVEDGKVTAVILFGQIGDELDDWDPGVRNLKRMARWLEEAGFGESTGPVGRRFGKQVADTYVEIDLYSPYDFSGLSDHANFPNFQRAIAEHEIVAYDGHSMLGASDFWSRPAYPVFYQVFLYGGCLGYEYYVRPIVEGKGGWNNVDIVSSVVEVSADANYYAGPFLAKLVWAIDHGYDVSWRDMLLAIRNRVGDSTFGVSGVRDNCFTPHGSRCEPDDPDPRDTKRYESQAPVAIPDNDPAGADSLIQIPDSLSVESLVLEIDVTHSWISDLEIVLEHEGVRAVVWSQDGGSASDIHQRFTLDDFDGMQASGDWTLHLVDHAAQDAGTLDTWALEIEPR